VVKPVGVLALQGDVEPHLDALRRVGAEARPLTRCTQLSEVGALVMPGGESTTMLRLMEDEPWFPALHAFHAAGGAILATCAGTILLAREVISPVQRSLGLLDATVGRNGFGRQVQSFETRLDVPVLGWEPLPVAFIRAPRILRTGRSVEVLARFEGEPVLVREGRVLAATMHPELTGDTRLHRMLVESVARVTA
jgi:5'-phosphate synthase pdxT subunit